jgi:hypothetical protein
MVKATRWDVKLKHEQTEAIFVVRAGSRKGAIEQVLRTELAPQGALLSAKRTVDWKSILEPLTLEQTDFFLGYVQAMGFTARAEHGEGQDGRDLEYPGFPGVGDFDENWDVWREIRELIDLPALREIVADVKGFVRQAGKLIRKDGGRYGGNFNQAGVDFCFTTQGQGAGYWDGDWEAGKQLSELCKGYGNRELVVLRNNPNDGDEITGVYFHG